MLGIIQPHADLNGVALVDPVKDVLRYCPFSPRIAVRTKVFVDSYFHMPLAAEEDEEVADGLETFEASDCPTDARHEGLTPTWHVLDVPVPRRGHVRAPPLNILADEASTSNDTFIEQAVLPIAHRAQFIKQRQHE